MRKIKKTIGGYFFYIEKIFQQNNFCLLFLVLFSLLFLSFFIDKAFSLDAPLFLWTAKHISTDPLSFYDLSVNWYGFSLPMYEINQNPPLVAYYIALSSLFFGWSEIALHIAFMLPAIMLIVGIFYLGKLFSNHSLLPSLIALLSPVFLASGTMLMSDISMLVFYVWSILFWIRAINEEKNLFFFIFSLLASCAFLSKYFGLTLIPLCFVYAILDRKKNW
ncbi:MAG: glycosyltransferase family 39 protein [Verrucomicrobiota bacterium]|nr:glycosyltransferase family 39 protein [Verrucomicrobiota bacterium]